MKPAITGHEAVDHDDLPVHAWKVARLTRLGIPELLAEIYADHLDWHQIARLMQHGCPDPELFFSVGAAGPALRQIDEAKRICRACPAREACLAWALEHGVAAGVWGGTTEDERRALRANHLRCKRQHAGKASQTPQQTHGRDRREVPPPAIPGTFSAPLQSSAARIRAASSGTNQKRG